MSASKVRRIDAAIEQLHLAIDLYLRGRDYFSAITLAGAAEGQLGQWAREVDPTNKSALDELRPIVAILTKKLTGGDHAHDEIGAELNEVRNWLKHYQPPDEIEIDAREEAYAMIDRAVINFRKVALGYTDHMLRFLDAENLEP